MKVSNKNNKIIETFIPIREGKLESIRIYQVTEEELDLLEKGNVTPLYLSLCIASFSIAISSTWAFFNISEDLSIDKQVIITAVMLVCYLSSGVSLYIWSISKRQRNQIISKIKRRMKQ